MNLLTRNWKGGQLNMTSWCFEDKKDWGRKVKSVKITVRYFFGYEIFFPLFQNNLKDLDPSSKMDLDLWSCFGRKKSIL